MLYKCISKEDYINIKLTVGKIYENTSEIEEMGGEKFLYIIDDKGLGYYVNMNDFILLDDFREDILNQLGI